MRPNILSLATLGLATSAMADYMVVYQYCYFTCTYMGDFVTDFGRYYFDMSDGCRGSTAVPGMTELCIDYRNDRAHFKFSHQGNKRCMRITGDNSEDCGIASCRNIYFSEVSCNWRLPADEVEEWDGQEGEADWPALESVSATVVASTAVPAASGEAQV
ncbi:hypothetical protein F5X68DRAFT_187635 [Plectosphaerella plurivora]|uniref:Uncharacterized protein n=1 Tax=Plectosphaerella plurivora TaxID=936078 RepID=A0A9P8VK76_9PEZI|nr:hypothetical protein F5X68DRAFT_187635 [Plectosphaerella plurivora]